MQWSENNSVKSAPHYFYVGSGDRTHVDRLVQQVLLPVELSYQPRGDVLKASHVSSEK